MIKQTIQTRDLIEFLEHIHLNGKVEQVLIESRDGILTAGFSTETRDLIGFVNTDKFNWIPSMKIAILDIGTLLRMCKLFDSKEVTMVINQRNDRPVSLSLSNDTQQISYAFGEPSIVPSPGKSNLPDPSVTFSLTKEISNRLINAIGVINDDMLYIMYDSLLHVIDFTIGDIDSNSNKIIVNVKPNGEQLMLNDVASIKFSAFYAKDVLQTIKTDSNQNGWISDQGILALESSQDAIQSTYYLIQRT